MNVFKFLFATISAPNHHCEPQTLNLKVRRNTVWCRFSEGAAHLMTVIQDAVRFMHLDP